MKAAVLHKLKEPFTVEDVAIPEIDRDEVLIETRTCGICRTDIHIQDGLAYVPELPFILGHEPAGVVSAVGEGVSGIVVGQRVVPHLFLTCGHCYYCRNGRDAQCSQVDGIIGVTQAGGFAEYFKAPAGNLLTVPDNVDFADAGLVSCGVITAVHAYRRARISVNDTVVILGVGGIGRILIQIVKQAGAKVVALSRSEKSLEIAKRDGADLTVSLADTQRAEKVKEFSGCEGAACVFENVGFASTMKAAADCTMRGGQIIVIGEEAEYPQIDTIQIAQRELEIIGSRNGSKQDAADALQMMSAGVIHAPIVATYPLEEFNVALDLARSGEAHGRVIVEIKK